MPATALAIAVLFTANASAAPVPPPDFSYDVVSFDDVFSVLPGCTALFTESNTGGACGSTTSGPGYAATSGGLGTPSYIPALGTGTAVDAVSTSSGDQFNVSNAMLTYSFEATGPTGTPFIPIDVLSTGLLTSSGDGTALLSMLITDSGTDANIPHGVPDPDDWHSVFLTESCSQYGCSGPWGTSGQQLTTPLCVVNGDNYEISIDALTTAGSGGGGNNSASALLDPEIKVDPPAPITCPESVDPTLFTIDTSPGTSTGISVPEPSSLGLSTIGLLALGFGMRRRRAKHA